MQQQKILLACGNENLREKISKSLPLKKHGEHRVFMALSAGEALVLYEDDPKPFDVIIIDDELPDGSVARVLSRLNQINRRNQKKTERGDKFRKAAGTIALLGEGEAGFDDAKTLEQMFIVLPKHVSIDQLAEHIRQLGTIS